MKQTALLEEGTREHRSSKKIRYSTEIAICRLGQYGAEKAKKRDRRPEMVFLAQGRKRERRKRQDKCEADNKSGHTASNILYSIHIYFFVYLIPT